MLIGLILIVTLFLVNEYFASKDREASDTARQGAITVSEKAIVAGQDAFGCSLYWIVMIMVIMMIGTLIGGAAFGTLMEEVARTAIP